MAEMIFLKKLSLMTPDALRKYGADVSGPALTDHIGGRVYRAGTALMADDMKGPLFYDAVMPDALTNGSLYASNLRNGHFAAVVEPLGVSSGDFFTRQSEGLKVNDIWVYCAGCRDEIEQGLIVDLYQNGFLFPVCGLEKHPEIKDSVAYEFRIGEDRNLQMNKTII